MDTTYNGGKPTLQMSIYDFIEYLTKEKQIYIDIKQFKRQLKHLKGKRILTVGQLLEHNKDFIFYKLHFNLEMCEECSRISMELKGEDIGELTKLEASRSEVYLDSDVEANWEEMRVKFQERDEKIKKFAKIAAGVLSGIAFLAAIVAIIIAVQPETMESKLIKMFDSIPQAPTFGSSFWDWQVNLNKWGELEDDEKLGVYYILTTPDDTPDLKFNKYVSYVYKFPEGLDYELAD